MEAFEASHVAVRPRRSTLADYLALVKPRIIALLLVTALCAMVVAGHGLPPAPLAAATLAGLTLASGGAHAINMWYDRDIDAVMQRTSGRPIPTGRLTPGQGLAFGVTLALASLLLLNFAVNGLTALLTLGGFSYYVFIYTLWLKRRTPLNIVIGGAAGAFPPLVGWAAVTDRVGLAAVIMFIVIFLWTPPHFWALALYRRDEYGRAGIPVMPVVRGERTTKRQGLAYAVLLSFASLLLYATGTVGSVYLGVAAALGIAFIGCCLALLRERAPATLWALRTFRFSILYLAILFAAMAINPHA